MYVQCVFVTFLYFIKVVMEMVKPAANVDMDSKEILVILQLGYPSLVYYKHLNGLLIILKVHVQFVVLTFI